MTQKTRDLPLYDFFVKLQEEYVCAELRYRIYPRQRDKEYYKNKVMEGKKKVINDIAFRNALPTIFNSDVVKQKIYSRIYGEKGFPNFIYKDECELNLLQLNDKRYYYSLGADVRVDDSNEIKIGKLDTLYLNSGDIVGVRIGEKVETYNINQITRIL